jgi:hypothetical protein
MKYMLGQQARSFFQERISYLADTCVEIDRIMSVCSFTTTSYAPSATSLLAQVTVQATKPTVSVMPSTTTATTGREGQLGISGKREVEAGKVLGGMIVTTGLIFAMFT